MGSPDPHPDPTGEAWGGCRLPAVERSVVGLEDKGKEDHRRVQSMPKAWPNHRLQVMVGSGSRADAAHRHLQACR
jgi:hypothetical protein